MLLLCPFQQSRLRLRQRTQCTRPSTNLRNKLPGPAAAAAHANCTADYGADTTDGRRGTERVLDAAELPDCGFRDAGVSYGSCVYAGVCVGGFVADVWAVDAVAVGARWRGERGQSGSMVSEAVSWYGCLCPIRTVGLVDEREKERIERTEYFHTLLACTCLSRLATSPSLTLLIVGF